MRDKIHRLLLALAVGVLLVASPAIARADSAATPATQALKIYKALAAQDYRSLFFLLAYTEKGQASLTTADQFASEVREGYDSGFPTPEDKAASDAMLASISNIMVGEPVVSGNKAVVPTSARITIQGQTYNFKGAAHLIKQQGVWKLDLTFDEDAEKTMSQRTSELLGSPEA